MFSPFQYVVMVASLILSNKKSPLSHIWDKRLASAVPPKLIDMHQSAQSQTIICGPVITEGKPGRCYTFPLHICTRKSIRSSADAALPPVGSSLSSVCDKLLLLLNALNIFL